MRHLLKCVSLLLVMLTLASCTSTRTPQSDTSNVTEATDTEDQHSTSKADPGTEVTQPVSRPKVSLPVPYINLAFTDDGEVSDLSGHVDFTFENRELGSVVSTPVSFGGKSYITPHYQVRGVGGALKLRYNQLTSAAELYSLLSDGFTLEAFVVNHVALDAGSKEQCMVSSCQSGGYNFTTHTGKYKMSVYTDSKYRNPTFGDTYSTDELTHLVGVYDAAGGTATLYVNGNKTDEVEAPGLLGLAQGDAWRVIVIGGDVAADGNSVTTNCTSFELTSFRLYTEVADYSTARTMYEAAVSELTGSTLDYDVEYTEKYSSQNAIFSSYNAGIVHNIYEPVTALTYSPTVWQFADRNTVSLASCEKRPATVVFNLQKAGGTLYATDTRGNQLGTLTELVRSLDSKIIPAFITGPETADDLIIFICDNRIADCFVISDNDDVLRRVQSATRCARPVLDCRALTSLSPEQLYIRASACHTKSILINATVLDNDSALALRARSLTIFASVPENDTAALHNAVILGANGIVSTAYSNVISYYESFEQRTLNSPPLIVAHRGDIEHHPHNVLSSFISAAESGASVTELDVWLTADGHLVINHDSTTTGFNEEISCTAATREQLKALKSKSNLASESDKISFYDEVMDYFSKNHTDMVFIVEIKDKRTEVVDRIVELTRQYGMEGRVLIICMNNEIVRYAMNEYGFGVQMNQSHLLDVTNPAQSLYAVLIECASLNSSFFTQWKNSSLEFNTMLKHRGIKYSPWTTGTALATDTDYARGYPEFTTNTPHESDKYVRYIVAAISSDGTMSATRINYDGTASDVTSEVELTVLSGNVSLSNGRVEGSGVFAVRYKTSLPLFTAYQYYIYSNSIAK